MDKFGTLIEESRIVLIRLNHKQTGIGEARGSAKVLRHATDEKSWVLAGRFEDPCEHGGGRSLTVGASDCKHPLRAQDVLRQPLRAGDIGLVAVENFFYQGSAAGDDVADHP